MTPEIQATEVRLKPKEIARMAAIGSDSEFGKILAYRTATRWPILLMLILPGSFALIAAAEAATKLMGPSRPTRVPNPRFSGEVFALLIGFVVSALVCALIVWWYRRRDTEHRFFEEGATHASRSRGDLQRLAYLDASALTYTLTRQYVNGAYVGTAGKLQLETPKGSGIKGLSVSFTHRERRKGGLFNRTFVGQDPMDIVRDTVADAVAERLALEIAEKGEAPWTGPTTFTKDGLRIKKLLGAPILTEYAKIGRLGFGDSSLTLFEEGSQRGFVSMPVNGKNFWPGFVLFQRLMTPRGGAEEIDGAEFDEEGD